MYERIKKMVLVEPYASVGGHPLRNVSVIPASFAANGAECTFVADRCLAREYGRGFVRVLTDRVTLQRMAPVEAIRARVQDYCQLLRAYRGQMIVLLSQYDLDLQAWVRVFADREAVSSILRHDTIVVIHNAGEMYPHMWLDREALQERYAGLEKNVYFTFFTEHQVVLARQICPRMSFFHLVHPSYDAAYYAAKKTCAKRWDATFLGVGFGDAIKNPEAVIDAIERMPEKSFCVQVSRVDDENVLPVLALSAQPNATRLNGSVPHARYLRTIRQSRVGLVPYDSYEYAIRESGMVLDFMLAGVPVVVPQHTWMARIVADYGHVGVVFDDRRPGTLSQALARLFTQYDAIAARSMKSADALHEHISTRRFIDMMRTLGDTRDPAAISFYQLYTADVDDRMMLRRGRVQYMTAVADHCLRHGLRDEAVRCLADAARADENGYWRIAALKAQIKGIPDDDVERAMPRGNASYRCRMITQLLAAEPGGTSGHMLQRRLLRDLPYAQAEQLRACAGHLDARTRRTIADRLVALMKAAGTPSETAALLGRVLFVYGAFAQASVCLRRSLRSAVLQDDTITMIRVLLLYARSCEHLGQAARVRRFSAKVEIIARSFVRRCSNAERYEVALAYKEAGYCDEALAHFSAVRTRCRDVGLRVRALFHSGECYMTKQDFMQARTMFSSLMAITPGHRRAHVLLRQCQER